jgi:hypothetical protein
MDSALRHQKCKTFLFSVGMKKEEKNCKNEMIIVLSKRAPGHVWLVDFNPKTVSLRAH